MNFFEQELRRLTKVCNVIKNPTFAGRACYGDLGGDNRFKLEFAEMGTFEKFEALKVSVLNRKDGIVDSLAFRFEDVWGRKETLYKNLKPHIWTYNGKSEWYSYRPTDAEIKQLATEIGGYLSVFVDRSIIPEKARRSTSGKDSVVEKIRSPKQPTAPPHKKSNKNKTDQEL